MIWLFAIIMFLRVAVAVGVGIIVLQSKDLISVIGYFLLGEFMDSFDYKSLSAKSLRDFFFGDTYGLKGKELKLYKRTNWLCDYIRDAFFLYALVQLGAPLAWMLAILIINAIVNALAGYWRMEVVLLKYNIVAVGLGIGLSIAYPVDWRLVTLASCIVAPVNEAVLHEVNIRRRKNQILAVYGALVNVLVNLLLFSA